VSAECRGQAIAATEEVDSTGLAIVLGENGAVGAMGRRDLVPRQGSLVNDFLPTKLIGIPLREHRSLVSVLHDGKFEGQTLGVADKAIGRQDRNGDRQQVPAGS
jgi:hypothetical protein